MPEDGSVWEDGPQAMLLRCLFLLSVPNRISHDTTTGRLHLAAAEVVSSSTVNDILIQLMWVRYSQYEVEYGGVGEPVVTQDLFRPRPRPLTDEENAACMAASFDDTYDQAWQRWREAWKASIYFTPDQQVLKQRVGRTNSTATRAVGLGPGPTNSWATRTWPRASSGAAATASAKSNVS